MVKHYGWVAFQNKTVKGCTCFRNDDNHCIFTAFSGAPKKKKKESTHCLEHNHRVQCTCQSKLLSRFLLFPYFKHVTLCVEETKRLMPGYDWAAGGSALTWTGALPTLVVWAVKVAGLLLMKIQMSEIIALKCFCKAKTITFAWW